MARKITSTELKQNTRKVIADVLKNPDEEVIVYTYNEPKVAIVSQSYLDELKYKVNRKKRKSKLELLEPLMQKGAKINSAKLIREMRDAE